MCIPDGFGCGYTIAISQEREAETIRRWCRRYLRIDRCDEQYSYFHFRRPIPKHNGALQRVAHPGLWSAAK